MKEEDEEEEEITTSTTHSTIEVSYGGSDHMPGFRVTVYTDKPDRIVPLWEAMYKNAIVMVHNTRTDGLKMTLKDPGSYERKLTARGKCFMCNRDFKNAVMWVNKKTGFNLCQDCYNNVLTEAASDEPTP